MSATRQNTRQSNVQPSWQKAFMTMLPKIELRLSFAFRHLDPEAKEEAMQEG